MTRICPRLQVLPTDNNDDSDDDDKAVVDDSDYCYDDDENDSDNDDDRNGKSIGENNLFFSKCLVSILPKHSNA